MDGEWDPLLDPQSPFCVALIALCETLRQLNAGADPKGADAVATQLLLRGRAGPAARYVGAAIRSEPANLPHWRALGPTDVGHCSSNVTVLATLAKLAADFGLDQDSQPIDARCYAQLWLGTAELPQQASAAGRRLYDLWRWSATQNLSSRTRADILRVLAGLDERVPSEREEALTSASGSCFPGGLEVWEPVTGRRKKQSLL